MRKLLIGALMLALPVFVACTSSTPPGTPAAPAANTISIKNNQFTPNALTVKAGDKVTFVNNDAAAHTATADDKSFDTGVINAGKSAEITVSTAGTFDYHCNFHPSMKAKLTVQ